MGNRHSKIENEQPIPVRNFKLQMDGVPNSIQGFILR